ncbi:AAA family ATPase [Cordyceps fumosorosea ARSEF 2679]|uniref:AAA family ATPase n=1 Tax=Cordyceps fumosorosea (strain ARSEF 2679) TaxID=1081104 RepID=A0A167TMX8_CORFA|nr:AAA family ATPase [Cordyceps fumosorosea ARSEF 2679]OAA60764.1 AAA family ATPase [Cordyceps fumosorosea ARSEF 2679]
MVQGSVTVKVRPLTLPGLEKKNLQGAARLYVSKESLIALTKSLEGNKPCVVERLPPDDDAAAAAETPIQREALLCVLPEKNMSPNIGMMTRAFQEATGFRLGDQVRIALLQTTADVEEVVVRDTSDAEVNVKQRMYPVDWRAVLGEAMIDAEQIFPGMVFEGVAAHKTRRNFKVLRVNGQADNLGRFNEATSVIRILNPGEDDAPPNSTITPSGELAVTGIPGLAGQLAPLNKFLREFTRPLRFADRKCSCAFVIHGGRGTGKTMILNKLAATGWGTVHWIQPSCKSTVIRETFKKAAATGQPSIILLDELEDLLAKDRSNHDVVVEALGAELDALAARASAQGSLPPVLVVAACLDFMANVPPKLQKQTRLRRNLGLRIPRAPERREILDFMSLPLRESEREACLASLVSRTPAFNGDDLATLVENAKNIASERIWEAEGALEKTEDETEETPKPIDFLELSDLEQALRITRPTAMNDVNLNPPTVHWQDIGGQEELKKILSRMIKNTKSTSPISYQVLQSPSKGLLLYGPPGCSKTLSAQALATESAFNFFSVKPAELLNMYVGESERAMRTLFERARAASPSIIFFDEIDSIGGQRDPSSGGGGSTGRSNLSVNMLNALLTEMDGFESLGAVIVLAATNRPDAMDPALLRPGRFDQMVYVGPPDEAARQAVFGVHLRGLSLAPDVDFAALARLTEGNSGAEIKGICAEAGNAVLERHEDTDGAAPLQIAMEDLEAAIRRVPRHITKSMTDMYEAWARRFRKT